MFVRISLGECVHSLVPLHIRAGNTCAAAVRDSYGESRDDTPAIGVRHFCEQKISDPLISLGNPFDRNVSSS